MSEMIRICNRLTRDELVMILIHDAAWNLPAMCYQASARMREAREVITGVVTRCDSPPVLALTPAGVRLSAA
jgi:hypothetical protein